jgi:Leucine rich repeat
LGALLSLAHSDSTGGSTIFARCQYIEYEFGTQYACIVRDFFVDRPDYVIDGTEAVHLPGKNQSDVEAIEIFNQYTRYLPGRLENIYWNMISYRVENSGLEYLGNFNFYKKLRFLVLDGNLIREVPRAVFGETVDLEWISMNDNRIETLDKDLFRNMPKLRVVSFSGNRLRRLPGELFANTLNMEVVDFNRNGMAWVGSDLLKSLTRLRVANFDSNICVNEAYFGDSKLVENLSRKFETYCSGQCDNTIEAQNRITMLRDSSQDMKQQMQFYIAEKQRICLGQAMRGQNSKPSSSSSSMSSSSSE